jgi:hypothetical protein
MALRRKRTGPVDRAVEDLDRQLATVQRQLQQFSTAEVGNIAPPRSASPATTVTTFVKEVLKPPTKSPPPPVKSRRDLFDVAAEPMKDLEAEPIAFAPKTDTDLFAKPPLPTRIDCAPRPEEKLAHYLSAGSIKSYKPLKHVQRKTRNRFFMWLGLSLVAVWLIWAVIR